MIRSTTFTTPSVRPAILQPPAKADAAAVSPPLDRLSSGPATSLKAEMLREPEVRAEVVARARALLADPAYPPMTVLQDIAGQILRSPDLSEDDS